MKYKVSVIVPVYNVEKYLRQCLDSLISQTLKDIEIIIVNDGTKDNSQGIIDEYVKRYSNVKAYIKENGGLGSARNYGIKKASGEYLAFIDSDDYVKEDMIEQLYNAAKKEDADYLICDYIVTYDDHKEVDKINKGIRTLNNNYKKDGILSPLYAWNKFVKKDLIVNNDLNFSEGLWYEDLPVTTILFALANKTFYLNKPLYYYRQRSGSIMNSKYNEKMFDIFVAMNKVYEGFVSRELLNEYHDEIEYLFAEHLMVYGAYRFLRTDHYKELLNKSLKLINEKFPNWKKNKYLKEIFNFKNRLFYLTICPLTYKIWKKIIEIRDQK